MAALKTIVITGASHRLGLFLCEHFCALNFQVYALTRTPSVALTSLASEHELRIFPVHEYTEENLKRVIQEIQKATSKIEALIHNASIYTKDEAFSFDQYQAFFRLHMAVPAQLNEGLKDLLYDELNPGSIVHITDIYAENPNKERVLYCSTKAGLENLARGYAKKYAPGVRVNAIQPGPIQFMESHTEETKKQVLKETLLGYEGGFMPIFQAINSLIENAYITGASIKVDGGRALGSG